jgi:predicted alpha-1,2-mannosidase
VSRRRARLLTRTMAACAAALTVIVTAAPADASPSAPVDPDAAGRDSSAATLFSSSFEAAVDTDRTGARRTDGVDGALAPGIPGSVNDSITEVTANAENTDGGEVAENVTDGDAGTKWLAFTSTGWLRFTLARPAVVVTYAMTSANDVPARDPEDWTLSGSADGVTWTPLDSRADQAFESRGQTKTYQFTNATAYGFYKLDITRNGGATIVQLADVQLATADTSVPPAPYMRSVTGRGPTSSPTAKPLAGFTGVRALQIAGRHLSEGRAYSYNKIFDVNIRVGPATELSYVVFPELTNKDLRYPATFAAVDLAFTDGTYLSELGAVDQNGSKLSPRGQGEAKTMYTQQWNSRRSTIGAVAAGKTIDRILVAYDAPDGPTAFRTWFDDIRVANPARHAKVTHPSDHVLTTRGTNSSGGFSRGNNFPATAVPHGFNFWTPLTSAGSTSWLYEYAHNNNAENRPTLQAFGVSHEPSPWMGDRQTFQVMPSAATGVPDANRANRALPFGHDRETARPYYYGVTFDNGIRTEIAPTDHAALMRFTFTGADSTLIFDNVNNSSALTIDAAGGVVTGWSDVRSGLATGATRMYVYATFDKPITASGTLADGNRVSTGYARFNGRTVNMRVATSLLSLDQAKHNLDLEIGRRDTLESVRDRAQKAWDDQLRVIEVEGATDDQLTTLYSNLYRLMLYPNSGFENTGSNERPVYKHAVQSSTTTPESSPTQTGAPIADGKVYVNNGFWDTYRTTWPAYTLLTPKLAGEMANGFVQQYKDGGWIARWSSPGYADLMVGTSSDVAFADAYLKGVTNFDVDAAYRAAVRNATVVPPNDNVGRKDLDQSIFLGYTPSDSTGEAMSWAMDGYINDFGIANLAKAKATQLRPGDPNRQRYLDEAEYFQNRALGYVNMFDPSIGFFQGRTSAGQWNQAPGAFDPREWGGDYTETDAWNMAFHVPQDGQGLANLYGGRDKLAQKLDTFFATPETALYPGSYGGVIHEMTEARDVRMGQYGHSNQPSHHIIYMYDYAGQPWKTQAKVREALSRLYLGSDIGQGYPGDEDNGEMSAWQIFGALGFYPLQMGSPYYAVGSPLFTKATINLENGRKIVVNARNNSPSNVYIQSLRVDGRPYDKTYLTSSMLTNGATLEFTMGPRPSTWGSASGAAPISLTTGSSVPAPPRDVSAGDTALFDNTSATQQTLTGPLPSAGIAVKDTSQPVTFYTLTSGSIPGDATDWVLEGSNDGSTWTTVDRRSDESFTSRRQTRPFKVQHPGRYNQYRLTIDKGTDPAGTTLSEVELLAPLPVTPSTTAKPVAPKPLGPTPTPTPSTTPSADPSAGGDTTGFLADVATIAPNLLTNRDQVLLAGHNVCRAQRSGRADEDIVADAKDWFKVSAPTAQLLVDAAKNRLCT